MFTPADIEFHTGWKVDALRDFRRKGYLKSYGSQGANGRWTYSYRDVVGFWIAAVLHGKDRVADPGAVFPKAHFVAKELARHLQGDKEAPRWFVELHTLKKAANGMSIYDHEFRFVATLDNLKGFYAVESLDLGELANLAPDGIRAAADR